MHCARALVVVVVVVAQTGCGRLGFRGEPDGAVVDTAIEEPVDVAPIDAVGLPAPIHHYRLDGDLRDDNGGLDLALSEPGIPGTFDSAGFRFSLNGGLTVTAGMPQSVYTIDIKLALDDMSYWRKIVDFKGRTIDQGLYAYLSQLSFVEQVSPETVHQSPATLVAGMPFQLTLTRDIDGVVSGYVNRGSPLTFLDTTGIGTFSDNGRAFFVTDDTVNATPEACPGVLREIRIWNVALTPAQVGQL